MSISFIKCTPRVHEYDYSPEPSSQSFEKSVAKPQGFLEKLSDIWSFITKMLNVTQFSHDKLRRTAVTFILIRNTR